MSAPGSIWQVESWPPGWTVRHVAETGSTNTDLLAALDAGVVGDRTALVADHQSAGRGRLDRTWEAPSGANLLVSLAFTDVPEHPAALTQRVGLAVVDGCRAVAAADDLTLKWPNDVILRGRKVAGILAQRSGSTGAVVVGVGLNVGWAPDGAEAIGPDVAVPAVLLAVLEAFDAVPVDCADRYRTELGTLGREVRVELPGGEILVGRAVDVDVAGRLVVVDRDGASHVLDVGDVVHATMT